MSKLWDIERGWFECVNADLPNITDLDELHTYAFEFIDNSCIYYHDCFEILQGLNETDFSDAFENGYTDVSGIACYYLTRYFFEESELITDALELVENFHDE